jgi:hypothetical protein
MLDGWWPIVGPMLQQRYHEKQRAYRSSVGLPWPERRSRKRKPIPGVLDVADDEAG